MNIYDTKILLQSCLKAKRIVEIQPKLPAGITPRHIFIIDVIHNLSLSQKQVKVSDISTKMQVTKPSITKLINELEQLHVITKIPAAHDKRITFVQLTELGESYYDFYIDKYHTWVTGQMQDITAEEVQTTAAVLQKLYHILQQEHEHPTFIPPAEFNLEVNKNE